MYGGYPQNNPYHQFNQMPFQNNGFTWVQGRNGANAFPTVPGSMDLLMDSERPNIFYLKTCERNGMTQPLREFEFKERFNSVPEIPPAENGQGNADLDSILSQISSLSSQIAEIRSMIENGGAQNA